MRQGNFFPSLALPLLLPYFTVKWNIGTPQKDKSTPLLLCFSLPNATRTKIDSFQPSSSPRTLDRAATHPAGSATRPGHGRPTRSGRGPAPGSATKQPPGHLERAAPSGSGGQPWEARAVSPEPSTGTSDQHHASRASSPRRGWWTTAVRAARTKCGRSQPQEASSRLRVFNL
jgi:hypothetical protein